MISRQEIMDFSREFGLSPNIVEKDYLLGWVLAGISNHGELGAEWIFKGGTCLKKCYFETYRFSEDLDFTVKKADHCNQEFLINAFGEVADWVYEEAGIEIPLGASAVQVKEIGKRIYKRWGKRGLERIAKMHFKTAVEIMNED